MDPPTKPSSGEAPLPSAAEEQIHNHQQIPQQQNEKLDNAIQHDEPNKPGPKTSSGEDVASEEERGEITPTTASLLASEEKRLVRKMDIHIIPLVMVLYVFSFLDR